MNCMASVNFETVGQCQDRHHRYAHTHTHTATFRFICLIKIAATSTNTFSMINERVTVVVWFSSSYFIHVIENIAVRQKSTNL